MAKDIKPNATYGEIRKTQEKMEWEKARGPDYWEYRKKWIDYPKKMYAGEFPLHLDIETTNVCNLKCVMCPRTVELSRKNFGKLGFMDFKFYQYLIDQGAENGVYSVKLNYLGEPLMHQDLPAQINYAKKRGVIEVMLNTNATLLDEEMALRLLDAGIDSIFFSVDSPYREKYNRIRVGADFDQVVQNIIRFVEIKDQGGYRHVQARISMTITDHDEKELKDFQDFWLQYVDIVGFGECIDHNCDYGSKYNPDFVCAQPFQRMFIMWDGVVTPCCLDDKRGYIVGDARRTELKEIWQGKRYQELRETLAGGRYLEIPICRRCYVPWSSLGDCE